MPFETTIDRAGRLIIPKPLRDRLHLGPGTRLQVTVEDGRLVLSSDRPASRLVERDGYLVLDLGIEGPVDVDHRAGREQRISDLAEYAVGRPLRS